MDNTPWARIGYNNIMVGTLDKMWCFSIDDVVDVALTCCQSFGPTTDSALVRRRGFSEVLSYYYFFIDGGVELYFGRIFCLTIDGPWIPRR